MISYDDMVYDSIKAQEEYQNESLQDTRETKDVAEPRTVYAREIIELVKENYGPSMPEMTKQ